ncbi:unnamed protein product [Discula destructiva]
MRPQDITIWKDFNIKNIKGWSHLLRLPYAGEVVEPSVITDSQRVIDHEKKVDGVALQWNVRVLQGPLRTAPAGTSINGGQVSVAKRQHCFPNSNKRTCRKNDLKPDMTIHRRATQGGKSATMLVMGDNKYSGAWDFETAWKSMHFGNSQNLGEDMRPFVQISTYCYVGETRYGHIMSDTELIAVRVFRLEERNASNEVTVRKWSTEVSNPIPWTASGRGTLTVNLPIWWLGVMAMNKSERAIKPRNRCPRINTWLEDKNSQGKTIGYTHLLSGMRVAADQKPVLDPVLQRKP